MQVRSQVFGCLRSRVYDAAAKPGCRAQRMIEASSFRSGDDTDTDGSDPDTWTNIDMEPEITAYYVLAYNLRDVRYRINAPGVEVWLDPGKHHDGAYLPWGTTVMGHRVTDTRAAGPDGWVILIHDQGDTTTRLWVPRKVHVDTDDTWRTVLVEADLSPSWISAKPGKKTRTPPAGGTSAGVAGKSVSRAPQACGALRRRSLSCFSAL